MNKTEFNAAMKLMTSKKKLDPRKIRRFTDSFRIELVEHIVRNRGPIVFDLIPDQFNWSWLRANGYLYQTKGKEYTFIHTSEHQIK